MMLSLKTVLSLNFSRTRYNLYKLYSKVAEQPERSLNLTDALEAQSEELPGSKVYKENVALASISMENPLSEVIRVEESSEITDKQVSCNKKVVSKSRKGKKCGQPKPVQPQDPGPPGGSDIVDKCDIYDIPKTSAKKWRTISYALVPLALGLSAFILSTREEGPEPEFIPYDYMYMRTKRFPWRDGKTSLFHGPNNLIPEEEEERLDREAEENQAPVSPPNNGEPAPPAKTEGMRYKRPINEVEDKMKRRNQHAQEELERRKKRHEEERNRK